MGLFFQENYSSIRRLKVCFGLSLSLSLREELLGLGVSVGLSVGQSLENFDKRLKSRFSECVEHIK